MECFFPAQSTGAAIYRALTAVGGGDVPAGRLPMTWPADIEQVWAYSTTRNYYSTLSVYIKIIMFIASLSVYICHLDMQKYDIML